MAPEYKSRHQLYPTLKTDVSNSPRTCPCAGAHTPHSLWWAWWIGTRPPFESSFSLLVRSSEAGTHMQYFPGFEYWVSVEEVKVAQLCLTLCDPMDYTVHGILWARILESVDIPFSRGSSQPRDWTQVSRIAELAHYLEGGREEGIVCGCFLMLLLVGRQCGDIWFNFVVCFFLQ